MKHVVRSVAVLFTGLVTFGCSDSQTSPRDPQTPSYSLERSNGRPSFAINATIVTPAGPVVRLTGGGSWDPSTASNTIPTETTDGHGNGGFSCLADVTIDSKLCAAGEGVRWDTVQLLKSSPFKCGGVANESGKTATTDAHVIVLLADFYRAGDGDNASFRRNMFVSDHDLADDVPGVQNIWIQGVGCGTGIINFNN
jgi:hypothetical protein